jgi:hypothetical protein
MNTHLRRSGGSLRKLKRKKEGGGWRRWHTTSKGEVGFTTPKIGFSKGGVLFSSLSAETGELCPNLKEGRLGVFSDITSKGEFKFEDHDKEIEGLVLREEEIWLLPWAMSPIVPLPRNIPHPQKETGKRLEVFKEITDGRVLTKDEESLLVKELDL